MRRNLGLAVVAVVLAAGAACSSGGSNDESSRRALPPNNKAAIEKVFSAELDRLGLRFTRGALVDARTRRPSDTGTHLAVYVEPTGPFTADDYASKIVAVTKVFAPSSFETWRRLTSFDVCQEPPPGVDDHLAPPPKSTVDMTRAASRKIDWDDLDLPQLLVDAQRLGSRQLTVYADREVRSTSVFQDARVKAVASSSRTSPTPPPPPSVPSYSR